MKLIFVRSLSRNIIHIIFLFAFVMLSNGNSSVAQIRGFTKEEISKTIHSESPVKQIKKGFRKGYGIHSYFTISPDGKWLVVQSRYAGEIIIIATDTYKLRRVPIQHPNANYAKVIGNFLIMSKASKKTDLYYYDLSKANTNWKKLNPKTIKSLKNRDLSLFFPVLNNKFGPKTTTKIMLFEPEKEQAVIYSLLIDFPRRGVNLSLGRDHKTVYLTREYGKGIYTVDNHPNSTPREIMPDGHNPAIGRSESVENFLLFNTTATENIYAYNLKSKTKHYAVRCYEGVSCFYPVFHPKDNRFYFIAGIEDEMNGVFETRFEPSLNRLEAPKTPGIWWARIENVDSDDSAVSFKFDDQGDQTYELNSQESIFLTWESLLNAPEVTVTLLQLRDDEYHQVDTVKLKGQKAKNGTIYCTKENCAHFENNTFQSGSYELQNQVFFRSYQYYLSLF